MDGLDCRHQTSDLNQIFHQWQFSFYVYHPISHFQTHKIINTDTCMPRGGPNYKLVFCPQLHNIYIYLITFFSSTTYQPTYLTKRGTTFFGGTSPNKLQVQHPSGRFCWKSLFPAQRRRCCSRPMAWLVVWNIFLCFHILGIRLPFD
jgi:hypothetical protein